MKHYYRPKIYLYDALGTPQEKIETVDVSFDILKECRANAEVVYGNSLLQALPLNFHHRTQGAVNAADASVQYRKWKLNRVRHEEAICLYIGYTPQQLVENGMSNRS